MLPLVSPCGLASGSSKDPCVLGLGFRTEQLWDQAGITLSRSS